MEKKQITLQLMIGERQFPVKTTEEDKHSVQKVAGEIQEKIRGMASHYRSRDIIDILSMLTLEYASKYDELKAFVQHREGEIEEKLNAILNNIEDTE